MDVEMEWSRLHQLVEEARSLLVSVSETFWSDWLGQHQRKLERFGLNGIESLTQGFGGMGSFNDLLILQFNGHDVSPADEDRINAQLDHLRSEIFRTAERIRTNSS